MYSRFTTVTVFPIAMLFVLGIANAADPRHADEHNDAPVNVPGAAEPKTDLAVYGEGVRSTDWRSPADERAGFHLPEGFEVRLFASEPQVAKPLNMAFDPQGRMWVTSSVEYPYPAKQGGTPRDSVKILADTDGDGLADEVTTFADKLNIPMGILPYGDGCLCFSIPNIWYLRDTDGDGVCDQREIVLGPFDTTRDTHGMINSFRDGGDGWIYACHGFNNQSEVSGSDGHVVTMHSGNTFRFRPDGSRVEHVTFGQVNPFGMTQDEWGYRYSADCHSKPITQLIHGACYPSFGKPHDGLGFLPPMVDHLHGSTAISGILYFANDSPVQPLRGQMISGNVMTSRLNRNQVVFHGATAKGREVSDFMTSDDPWFRPVDIRMGKDGNIYVADFYNKIIGHYEVPLNHPGRDRTSGRIWQIRYVGDPGANNESTSSEDRLCARRIRELSASFNRLDDATLADRLQDNCPQVRVHALRLATERKPAAGQTSSYLAAARSALRDSNAHVVRAAAELLGIQGKPSDIDLLRNRLSHVDAEDAVLRQTIRIALRNRLQSLPSDSQAWKQSVDADLASIFLGIAKPETSGPLLAYLTENSTAPERDALLAHAAKHSTADSLEDCVRVARQITGDDRSKKFALLDLLCDTQNARPGHVPTPLKAWALDLVDAELSRIDANEKVVAWSSSDGEAWPRESRKLRGGGQSMLVSSFGRGEKYRGKLVSDHFPAPQRIEFRLAGHNGFPDQADHGKNRVRLVEVSTGRVLHQATPPRNDTAVLIRWDTRNVEGKEVRIECIDNDNARAYAWIALGEFSPKWIGTSGSAAAMERSLNWISRLGLNEKAKQIERLLRKATFSRLMQVELARSLASLRGNVPAAIVLQFMGSTDASGSDIAQAVDALLDQNEKAVAAATKSVCKRLSSTGQREFAIEWAKQGAKSEQLIEFAKQGWIGPAVLVDENVKQTLWPGLTDEEKSDIDSLTKDIDPEADKIAILAELKKSVRDRSGDRENGHRLFTKHCAACHQLRGEGNVVGPQLDGAASRSVDRLLEDVVTPDRNVDRAFRTTSFLIDDGRVLVGLVTHETEKEITLVQPDGKPIRIDPATVERRREAGRSLMPSNMHEVLATEDFGDLIHFVRGG